METGRNAAAGCRKIFVVVRNLRPDGDGVARRCLRQLAVSLVVGVIVVARLRGCVSNLVGMVEQWEAESHTSCTMKKR